MKRFIFPLLLFVVFVIISPAAVFAGNRSVTILYTGSVKGYIEPCFV